MIVNTLLVTASARLRQRNIKFNMTITKQSLATAILGLWLAGLSVWLVMSPPTSIEPTVPTLQPNGDGTYHEQAPDLSKESAPKDDEGCISYDGNYDNDTCPE